MTENPAERSTYRGTAVHELIEDAPTTREPLEAPFDRARLDASLAALGADVAIATSRHNVRYLLGGYECRFFSTMDALGLSRYAPAVAYVAGDPSASVFVASPMDGAELLVDPVWVEDVRTVSFSTVQTAEALADWFAERRLERPVVAVEKAFIALDLYEELTRRVGGRIVDATAALDDLRAVKRPDELELLERASDLVVAAQLATFARARPGLTGYDIGAILAEEERRRGLGVDYTLVGIGKDVNRTPSPTVMAEGDTLNLDSGGNVAGYIGDLSRMAMHGEPSADQARMLAEVDAVQLAGREPIRAGALGREIYEAALAVQRDCRFGELMEFLAHGMGLVSHEAPRLAHGAGNPIGYPPDHLDRPLEAGMVLSLETTIVRPGIGWVKLEDTVLVTDDGHRALGDEGRGWNPIGAER